MEENIREDARILWRFLSQYKKDFYTTLVVVFLGSVFEAIVPYVYGKIVDFIVGGQATRIIFEWLLLWFFLQMAYTWMKRYLFVHAGRISVQCANDLVLLLNQHSINLQLSYHNRSKSGKLSSRYIKAADALEAVLESVVFWFGADILLLLSVLVLIGLYIHPLVFAIVVASIILFVYISVAYSKPISEHSLAINKEFEEAYGVMHDSVANIKLVKASSGEEYEGQKSTDLIKGKVMSHFEGYWKTIGRFFFLQDLITATLTLVSVGAMIYLYQRGEVQVGQVVTYIGYLPLLRGPLQKAGDRISHYRRWMATVRRGYSLLEEETEDYSTENKIELHEVKGAVEFDHVYFAYNQTREVLHDIDLKVKPGEIVALVGESGVGKSTLVDLIPKYIIPTRGRVLLDGIDIQMIALKNLRDNIAIVPQDVSMFNDTVRHNLVYGKPDATEEEINAALEAANARQFIDQFPNGLEEQVGERGVQLSGGQKQRIAIARAILKDPKILILDEATSALDSRSEALVQQAMNRLMRNRTTFIIAHRLSTIVHSDRIVVLDKGRIVEQGTHKELLEKRGAYYKLYTLQSLAQDKRE